MCVCVRCTQVVALDAQAAYQLCAMSGKTLLLWDLRAGQAAAAALPLQAPQTVLQAMPGGQVLLSAAANGQVRDDVVCVREFSEAATHLQSTLTPGLAPKAWWHNRMRPETPPLCFPVLQVCLYDVRRLANSSIVNFGSSRANQQLLLTHSVRARAQAAGFSSGGCSVSYGVAHDDVHFLSDAVLNPVDPNLLAYIRPNLQVWSLVFLRNRMGWAGAITGWSCVCWGGSCF